MNILSSQEMRQTQIQLLKLKPKTPYSLKTPTAQQLAAIHLFQGTLFPPAGPQTQAAVQRLVTLTDNLHAVGADNPNAVFHMLIYNLMTVLYQQKYRGSGATGLENNAYLMESIKCSLYSRDADLTIIKHGQQAVDNLQLKRLAAQFFAYMGQLSSSFNTHRMKCVEWLFQNNPMLLELFVLLFRFILYRLSVEDAEDYSVSLDACDCITNLIEYFDLNYRSLGELFLYYEDGLFLTVNEKEIVMGEYFENEREKENQKKQLEIKSSVKMNMVESFLLNVDEKHSNNKRKNGIVASDVKLFNFMLQNSYTEEHSQSFSLHEKDLEMETPHFKDNQNFHFGKRKKEEDGCVFKPEEIRNEFEKLIMDDSVNEIQSEDLENFHAQLDEAPTPFLGGAETFHFGKIEKTNENNRSAKEKIIEQLEGLMQPSLKDVKIIDSPVDSIFDNFLSSKNQPEFSKNYITHPKNRMSMEDKLASPYTPQTLKINHRDHGFSSMANNANFYKQEDKAITEKSNNKHQEMAVRSPSYHRNSDYNEAPQCRCRTIRLAKNAVASRVVDVIFAPPAANKKSNYLAAITSPRFLNFKQADHRDAAGPKSLTPNKYAVKEVNTQQAKIEKTSQITEERKPTFLKYLKKQKTDGKNQQMKDSDNPAKTEKKVPQMKTEEKAKFSSNDKFKRLSCIVSPLGLQNEHPSSKSTKKDRDEHSNTKFQRETVDQSEAYKRFDTIGSSPRTAFGKPNPSPWQTTSNFHQRMPYQKHVNHAKSTHFQQQSQADLKTISPLKFFAPVQIIAPTVYLTSKNQNNNKIIFKINDLNEGGPSSPQARKNSNIFPTPPVLSPKGFIASNKSDKVINYFASQN